MNERNIGMLYARPSFVEGAARLVDFGNTLSEYNTSPSGGYADRIALHSDLVAIGRDMEKALEKAAAEVAAIGGHGQQEA